MKEKNSVTDYAISISNPNELILKADDVIRLRKIFPSDNAVIKAKEKALYEDIPSKEKKEFKVFMFEKISSTKIEDKVNFIYQDGIDIEEYKEDEVRIPYSRTLRVRPKALDTPDMEKALSLDSVTIDLGNIESLSDGISIQRYDRSLLALSRKFDPPTNRYTR